MANFLRQIVAGPRSQHEDTGLDLCYVVPNIIATSGPSQTYPQRAYRNPLDRLVTFLDGKHGQDWAIWEFRAEGTGYPDEAVYGRIRHYPWPDHHPPPFRLLPLILASMRSWLSGEESGGGSGGGSSSANSSISTSTGHRVVVVHCKAGKGRSGTVACSYLMAECGWDADKALARFTERRMRPGFGAGLTIPSQLRWIGYVDRWRQPANLSHVGNVAHSVGRRCYVDRPVEIVEIHVWGLRHGVRLSVEGFVDEGRRIRVFHTFRRSERHVVEGSPPGDGGFLHLVSDMVRGSSSSSPVGGAALGELIQQRGGGAHGMTDKANEAESDAKPPSSVTPPTVAFAAEEEPGGRAVIFRPETPIRIPNSDVNIAMERRNKTMASLGHLTMVTAVAHAWFNIYFEGHGPEQGGHADDSGVFSIDWEQLDGIKGSSTKGTKAADRIAVVWRAGKTEETVALETSLSQAVDGVEKEGGGGAHPPVPQMRAANWRGGNNEDPDAGKELGLRIADPESVDVSRASSIQGMPTGDEARTDEAPKRQSLDDVV